VFGKPAVRGPSTLKAWRLPLVTVTDNARDGATPRFCRERYETSRRMRFCHKAAAMRYVACVGGRVIKAVTFARATQRDPELATIPAKRAMRTRSESEDACIFVIKLAR
jgi:hypothetical protein